MFLEDGPETSEEIAVFPTEVPVRVLLGACAVEAERQADGLRALDAAIGAALSEVQRQLGVHPVGQDAANRPQDDEARCSRAAGGEAREGRSTDSGRRGGVVVLAPSLLDLQSGQKPMQDGHHWDEKERSERTGQGQAAQGQTLQGQITLGQTALGQISGRSRLPALIVDLQMADRMRQEAEGLARVLALLAQQEEGAGPVCAADIRACTPIAALQRRLLSPVRP